MRELEIRHIRENPWLVLLRELPEQPDRLLLTAALLAAEYCRDSERIFMEAARDGRYALYKWSRGDAASAFDNSKFFYEVARTKTEEISDVLMNVSNGQIRRMEQ